VTIELDHVVLMCEPGAPEAARLARLGLHEGAPNTHQGQGTSCRRFMLRNAYLELLWVHDVTEAQRDHVRRLRVWERWSRRRVDCPFGIVVRPGPDSPDSAAPFPVWSYRPSYLPAPLTIGVGETPLDEPGVYHLPFQRGPVHIGAGQTAEPYPPGVSGLRVGTPSPGPLSDASRALEAAGIASFEYAPAHVLRVALDDLREREIDLRPDLPLVLVRASL
jgi:hypothetical protein